MPERTLSPSKEPPNRTLTPELVRKVADKVYALLQADLQRERERARTSHQLWKTRKYR